MSSALKFIKRLKMLRNGTKLLSAAVVTLAATATGVSKSKKVVNGKDEILFLSKEDNAVPSTARIITHEIRENRDPVLPNGDLNWACTCIEKDVIGPCNIEFRKLRQFMHVKDLKEDIEAFDPEMRMLFDKLFEDFIICTMDKPVYYKDSLLEEEIEELERIETVKKELAEKKRQEKEANRRHFGKDEVVFLTKEENRVPSTVVIPKVPVEENRAPLLPNGEINWACTCIEKDVVGPCNIEFREFRKFVAFNRDNKDEEEITEEGRNIIGNFIGCIRTYPLYYSSFFSKENDEDVEDDKDFDKSSETSPPGNNGR